MTYPAALPISMARSSGSLVFVSGQIALQDGKVIGADIAAQTDFVIDAIERELAKCSLGLSDIIKTSVWIVSKADFSGFNAAYATRFTAPYPARATVVSDLVVDGALIEIDAIAARRPEQL